MAGFCAAVHLLLIMNLLIVGRAGAAGDPVDGDGAGGGAPEAGAQGTDGGVPGAVDGHAAVDGRGERGQGEPRHVGQTDQAHGEEVGQSLTKIQRGARAEQDVAGVY